MHKDYLLEINKSLLSAQVENNRQMPHHMITNSTWQSKLTFLWLTHNISNKSFKKYLNNYNYNYNMQTAHNCVVNITNNLSNRDRSKGAAILMSL